MLVCISSHYCTIFVLLLLYHRTVVPDPLPALGEQLLLAGGPDRGAGHEGRHAVAHPAQAPRRKPLRRPRAGRAHVHHGGRRRLPRPRQCVLHGGQGQPRRPPEERRRGDQAVWLRVHHRAVAHAHHARPGLRGNHLSNANCITHVFFRSGE